LSGLRCRKRQEKEEAKKKGRHPRNYGWAEFLKRVFEIDVPECPE
jgi:hypothetical protein